ncbi:MAG: acyl-CoA thioesterase [bacterium]|jgi:4-hydroxybenzoyl-CoA thioesterase
MLKYTLTIKISWGHCDPAKIVFYPNYFIWFDQSAHLLFDKAGANMGDLMKQYGVVGLPIVDVHAEFIRPSKYGDVIEVTSWISEWRAKTMIASHEIHNNGQLCVKGTEVRVWAKPHPSNPNRLQAQVIPDSIKACFEV